MARGLEIDRGLYRWADAILTQHEEGSMFGSSVASATTYSNKVSRQAVVGGDA